MNQHLLNFLTVWATVLSTVLGILKIIDRKKKLNVVIELKKINYENEEGDQITKMIEVKILNKTNYNLSIQNIVFIASRYFFIIPFKLKLIPLQQENEMSITLFRTGESKIYEYDMSHIIYSDGSRNIDILRNNEIKNYYIRARIIYPDNSTTDSKKGILIRSILTH